MAKKWIKGAVSNAHGQFRKKAEAAGKTTREFAAEHEHDSGKTGKQARLAKTLMGMHHKEGGSVDETSSDLPENVQNFIHDTIMAERQHSPASHAKGGLVKRAMSRYSSKTVRRPA